MELTVFLCFPDKVLAGDGRHSQLQACGPGAQRRGLPARDSDPHVVPPAGTRLQYGWGRQGQLSRDTLLPHGYVHMVVLASSRPLPGAIFIKHLWENLNLRENFGAELQQTTKLLNITNFIYNSRLRIQFCISLHKLFSNI